MKITKLDIPASADNADGLDAIKMYKLNQVVLLTGKNGSGKTRILNKIVNRLNDKPKKSVIDNIPEQIRQLQRNIINFEQASESVHKQLEIATDLSQQEQFKDNIRNYTRNIDYNNNELIRLEAIQSWNQIETSELAENYTPIPFVPKNITLQDNKQFPINQIKLFAERINTVGIDFLADGALSKIQTVQDKWFNVTHPSIHASDDERKKAIDDYERLKNIIKIFLNEQLDRNINGEATLFGFPIGQTKLSEGQIVLLQLCIAIYSQETALKDLILIMDEPENHLHPSVIIEIIERIKACVSNGQIWIATHSIPLLAHFDPSLIWYVENGKVKHAGKIPEKVLHSLLGDDDEVSKLQDFIGLPAQYATNRYAFDSLFEPQAVNTDNNDPQTYQIRKELLHLSSKGKLRILDYGAGKGRLISNIVDMDESNQPKLLESIDYIAYNKFQDDNELCECALIKAYGNSDKRYFNNIDSLLSVYDKGSFGVVIMCNVLHEIDPNGWLDLFRDGGTISKLLSDDGVLLLVEDHQIPVGEKAYQKGFLVLDTPHLKELFKITAADTAFNFSDQNGDGRLKAHCIPKNCLIRIDAGSRLEAIKSLSKTAREKILEIREMEQTYQNGKLHGFWTQQFANAQLNITQWATTE